MKKYYIIGLLLGIIFSYAQEIQAEVNVNYAQVQTSNNQVFNTLQKELAKYINNTKWTGKTYSNVEKIQASFTLIINEKLENNSYSASLIVQSQRPVYNTAYGTPMLNFNDKNFTFKYVEFEPLIFNNRKFSGDNLTDVIAYYIYLILGIDGDSFALNGGQIYFDEALKISSNAEGSGYPGWSIFDGLNSRSALIADITKGQNNTLRNIWYNYHRQGLDLMVENESQAKTNMANSLTLLEEYDNNLQFYPLNLFIESKKSEMTDIFSGGKPSTTNIQKLKEVLKRISPMNGSEYWDKFKN